MEPETQMWSVEEWLERIGMSEYAESFVDNGYETVDLVSKMKADDMDAVGVKNKKDRGILFTQARLLLETTGVRPPALISRPSPDPAPVITLSMSGSASPTTPSNKTPSYSEPWNNTPTPLQSPSIIDAYSEPWKGSDGSSSTSSNTIDGDRKPPPLPPPNKGSTKGKKPPPSPGIKLPEYKREDGEKGFTKLQLKLKIRDELLKDSIALSEHPFCNVDGSLNEEELVMLAEDYANRFKVESLGVYDALKAVWAHTNNNSEFVIPSKILQGGPSDNYEEPFDTQSAPIPVIVKVSAGSASPKDKNASKGHALSAFSSQSTYEEPFDTVSTPRSPPKIVKPSRVEQSKTLPSPQLLKKPAEAEEKPKDSSKGLGRLFRRKEKARSQSVKEELVKGIEGEAEKKVKKHGRSVFPDKSKTVKGKKRLSIEEGKQGEEDDTLGDMAVVPRETSKGGRNASKSVRASVAGYPTRNGNSGSSPKHRGSFGSGSSSRSESDDSPQQRKKHGGRMFRRFITPPTLKRNQSLEYIVSSGSDDDKTPPALRRLRQLGNNTGSNTKLEVSDDDSRGWMQGSKSYNNLSDVLREDKKSDKKKGLFTRLRNLRKTHIRKSSKEKRKPSDSEPKTNLLGISRENSLTASISMPDIASMSILKQPSPIPEHLPINTSSPSKPSHSFKQRSPLTSQIHTPQHTPPEQHGVLATSAPTGNNHFSNRSPPDLNSTVSMVRTKSSGSAKSQDLTNKPPPPPKPSTLTKKPKPVSIKDGAPQKSTRKISTGQQEDIPAPSEAVKVDKMSTDEPVSKAPPKPMRKSIKRGGVTEQRRKDIENTPENASIVPVATKEGVTPTDSVSSSQVSVDSTSTGPTSAPPPKPSRNYKSVKILTRPPSKPALSEKPQVVSSGSDGGSNIKPSEVLRRSRSPATESPDHAPSLSQGSEGSQEARPTAKPRTSLDNFKKPSPPPNKPPRKSIKLKN